MPPKQPRRSDVSTARFEVMEEGAPAVAKTAAGGDQSLPTGALSGSAVAGASAGPAVPAATSGVEQEERKDKDKDAERKDKGDKDAIAIEDLTLPKSIITRLAKGVLPPNTQIQANAIMALNKSATVFISYLASHANENTIERNKATIMPDDVFKALEDTEFSFLVEPLKAEYEKFASDKSNKRKSYRASKKAVNEGDSQMADISAGPGGPDDTVMTTASGPPQSAAGTPRDGPQAKKAKIGAAAGVAGIAGVTAAQAAGGNEVDDDETEPEDQAADQDDDEDDEDEEEEEEEEESEAEGSQGGDDEDRVDRTMEDEALEGDESD